MRYFRDDILPAILAVHFGLVLDVLGGVGRGTKPATGLWFLDSSGNGLIIGVTRRFSYVRLSWAPGNL